MRKLEKTRQDWQSLELAYRPLHTPQRKRLDQPGSNSMQYVSFAAAATVGRVLSSCFSFDVEYSLAPPPPKKKREEGEGKGGIEG